MHFSDTTATKKIFSLRKRIRAVAGGTSASKTVSILIWCIDRAQAAPFPELISIVSESYPHLEDGAMRDFKLLMRDRGYWDDACWHDTKHEYRFSTGTTIEFLAVNTYGKAHGPRRDILFLNECNNLEYTLVDQLIVRTRKIVWMDWNPTSEFWFYTEMLTKRDDIDFLTLTYLDNEALDEVTVREIESHKSNANWWKVYGLGQLGQVEGRIYRDWEIIDTVPHEARLTRRWLDFGYSSDPTAIGDVYYFNGGYILDEQLYQRGMLNKPIADFLLNLPDYHTLIIADCAEPKSIDDIRSYGLNMLPSLKGEDSIRRGIKVVQDMKISVTRRSVNLLKEYRSYLWLTDKNGKQFDPPKPTPGNDHHLDGIRYALESLKPPASPLKVIGTEIGNGLTEIPIYNLAPQNSGIDFEPSVWDPLSD